MHNTSNVTFKSSQAGGGCEDTSDETYFYKY